MVKGMVVGVYGLRRQGSCYPGCQFDSFTMTRPPFVSETYDVRALSRSQRAFVLRHLITRLQALYRGKYVREKHVDFMREVVHADLHCVLPINDPHLLQYIFPTQLESAVCKNRITEVDNL